MSQAPGAIVDEAIDWSVKILFGTPDNDTRQAFEDWLATSPAHRQAWQRMQRLGEPFAGLPASAALATLERLPEGRLRRRQALKLLAIVAGVGASAWSTREYTPWQRLLADYSTRIGEHRRWTLADGSVLALNTDSAVRADFDGQQRQLTLLRGELALDSARESRPLRLRTPQCLLETFDSRFEVRLLDGASCLSVLEGTLQVTRATAPAPLLVRAGERWRITPAQALPLPAADPGQSAWRDGMFIARDLALGEVLAELDRYRIGYLGCDPRIAPLRISGNFSTERPDQALALIASSHHLRLQRLTRYWVRLLPA